MTAIGIDFRTLVLSLALLYIVQAIILVVLYRSHKDYQPTVYWAQGAFATAIGAVLFILRDQTAEWVSVFFSNAFLLLGTILPTGGVLVACGRRPPWRSALLLWAIYLACLAWFYYAAPSFQARVALYHLAISAVLLVELIVLFDPRTKATGTSRGLIAIGTVLCLIFGAMRAASTLHTILEPTLANILFVWAAYVRCFTQTAGCTMLVGEHYRNELVRVSNLDPLTGLMNRRAFNEIASRLWAQGKRLHWPMSFMMIDIDHFKTINDRFGHAAGDEVLRNIGELLHRRLREDDLVGRLGGEEFAVILPNTDGANAEILAERIRSACAAVPLPDGGKFSVSIGIANSGPDDGEWLSLLELADQALYQAKSQGRDRVIVHTKCPVLGA